MILIRFISYFDSKQFAIYKNSAILAVWDYPSFSPLKNQVIHLFLYLYPNSILFFKYKLLIFRNFYFYFKVQTVSTKKRGYLKSLKIIFASLHFAKVLIAGRATTFGKVDYSDYQQLLKYVIYERFANTPSRKI